jgi:CheY-like chemotaxis protein
MAHILLIDDSELALEFTQMMLEAEGHTVVATADPAEFMRQIEGAKPPDIAIVDAVMPDVSGPELIQQLRAHSNPRLRELPVLLSSALDGKLPALSGVLLLPKPFGPDELQQALNLALG